MTKAKVRGFQGAKSVLLMALCGGIAGCASPVALNKAFIGYTETYASIANEQMLLNLARRANNHPSYFLQLGSINSAFQFGASLNGQSATTNTDMGGLAAATAMLTKGVSNVVTGGGSIGVTAAEQPVFSITPLSGALYSAAVFKPMDVNIFYDQMAHGVPVDMLLRLMVYSVTLEYPSGKVLILNNRPDAENPNEFRNFLRHAAVARQLQNDGVLIVDKNEKGPFLRFAPKASESFARIMNDEKYAYWAGMQDITSKDGIPKISFATRTFSGVLGALGVEQKLFETWDKSANDVMATVPDREHRPIIRISWDNGEKTTPSVVETTYLGKNYKIADPDDGSTWNRESFRLLTGLYDMVAMDPKALPMQQLIQLH